MTGADEALATELRARLRDPPAGIYLNTSAEGLWLRCYDDAWRDYADAKSAGSAGRGRLQAIEAETRQHFAELIGAESPNIALVTSTSRGLDAVIKSMHWNAGDELVTADTEFPGTLFAAEHLRTQGVDVVTVASRGGAVHAEDVVDAISDRTRLVVLSLVSFKTGQRLNPDAIVSAAHRRGALVFIDAVQGVGAVEYRVGDEDFVCAAGFKWLMGAHGAAGLYVSERALGLVAAPYIGYRGVVELFPSRGEAPRLHDDARRFEEGMPSYLPIAVLGRSLRVIRDLGIERIAAHDRALADRLRRGLRDLGIRDLCPDDAVDRGPIVAFETPRFAELEHALSQQHTTVWARDGRVRASVHAYNTAEEVDRFLGQLASANAAFA